MILKLSKHEVEYTPFANKKTHSIRIGNSIYYGNNYYQVIGQGIVSTIEKTAYGVIYEIATYIKYTFKFLPNVSRD